jgi:hypothetical protein
MEMAMAVARRARARPAPTASIMIMMELLTVQIPTVHETKLASNIKLGFIQRGGLPAPPFLFGTPITVVVAG